jgi:hypothetical protein
MIVVTPATAAAAEPVHQMDVGVDHPGQDEETGGVDDPPGFQLLCPHRDDYVVGDVDVGPAPRRGRDDRPALDGEVGPQLVLRIVSWVHVSASHRRHLARRRRASRTGSRGEHFDEARGVGGRREACDTCGSVH